MAQLRRSLASLLEVLKLAPGKTIRVSTRRWTHTSELFPLTHGAVGKLPAVMLRNRACKDDVLRSRPPPKFKLRSTWRSDGSYKLFVSDTLWRFIHCCSSLTFRRFRHNLVLGFEGIQKIESVRILNVFTIYYIKYVLTLFFILCVAL